MKQRYIFIITFLLSILVFAAPERCAAQDTAISVSDLIVFGGTTLPGAAPAFFPAQGRNGLFYGVIGTGNQTDPGSVFNFSAAGAANTIYTAPASAGYAVFYGLTLGTDGNFYGVVESAGVIGTGAYGNLFKATPSGTFTVLHYFNGGSDGGYPFQAPIEASDGNFYGVTAGACCLLSTVYKYSRDGVFSTIFTFSTAQGSTGSNVIEGADGDLYVTCSFGGSHQNGSITRMTKGGKLVSSYSFPAGFTAGSEPAGLVAASDGNYYGATLLGGNQNHGVIFRMTPQMTVTIIHTMNASNGGAYSPGFFIQATDGYLYAIAAGGTYGNGAIIRISTSGKYSEIYSFPTSMGNQPTSIVQVTSGLFYGTLAGDGTYGAGAVYRLDMHLAPFITFVLPVGKVGESAQILGQKLTGTTSVTFDGIPATSFTVKSDTFMTAVVPTGATTGKVVVTTPTGKLTSNVRFRILK
jgi:hypothetical protein